MTLGVPVRVAPQDVVLQRHRRLDAARNYDALIAAAREEFDENGVHTSLKAVARRAGVGIATLYRHFPTRGSLIESVYVDDVLEVVNALCRTPGDACAGQPWEALAAWLGQFTSAVAEHVALREVFSPESVCLSPCRQALCQVVGHLLEEVRRAGAVRRDLNVDEFLCTVVSVAVSPFLTDAQRDRALAVFLDGIRTHTDQALEPGPVVCAQDSDSTRQTVHEGGSRSVGASDIGQ
ncbi:TetR/AcrR family transcriptional regulator [Streptomyces sp. NPDC001530]|uniref:TetR/AcrR family transcriptional regulator n=1 Tax=Streptomyces sp. NPDC001530 TaxID=3364582 RepID=UPI003675B5CE